MSARTSKARPPSPELQPQTHRCPDEWEHGDDGECGNKIHQILDIYGPREALRLINAAFDRLIAVGVQ